MKNTHVRARRFFRLVLAGGLTFLCGFAAAADEGRGEVARTSFVVTLVDQETGKPIGGADVRIRMGGKGFKTISRDITSYADGVCKVAVPKGLPDPHYLTLSIQKADGYVLATRGWGSYPGREPVPETFTLRLERATSIGGVVTNEEGEPIEGVKLEFSLSSDGREVAYRIPPQRTDAQGRWRSDHVPPRIGALSIRLEHPHYSSSRVNTFDHSLPEKLLRDFSGTLILKRGFSIFGVVRDDRGEPIESALVKLGSSGFSARHVRSGADGTFSFENCKPQSDTLTVEALGKSPEMRRVDPTDASERLEFRMRPGREVRIRVVDVSGEPVEGVTVYPETYRGCRYILSFDSQKGEKQRKTDKEGLLHWTSAPEDGVTYAFSKEGYARLQKTLVPHAGEVQIVKLPKKLTVRVKVVEKATGEPLRNFRVVRVLDWLNSSPPFLEDRELVKSADGTYEYELSRTDTGHYVRIEADGYAPSMSPMFKLGDEEELSFDFELVKGKNIQGFIKDPHGNPVESAEVVLCTPSQQVYLYNGELSRRDWALVTTTGADGQFSLYPESDPYVLVVLHDSGGAVCTQAELEKSSVIRIRPWAVVRGKLLRSATPLPNQRILMSEIRLYNNSEPHLFSRFYTTTNAEGEYEFARVLPGSYSVGAELGPWQASDLTSSHNAPLRIEAGQTVRVNLGQAEGTVVGRAVLPEGVKRKIRWSYGINWLVAKRPGIPAPPAIRDKGFDWRKGWEEAWMGSREGQAYFQTLERYFVKVNPDGTFRIDGVPPGDFQLALRAFDPPEGGG